MNIHLFKNVSEGNLIEIKQRKIIKALNDILIHKLNKFHDIIKALKDNIKSQKIQKI